MPLSDDEPIVVVDALAARFGGTAVAAARIARGLARADGIGEVVAAVGAGSSVARELADDPHLRLRTVVPPGRGELARRLAWEAVELPRLARRSAPTVVFTLSGILPRSPGAPVVSYLGNSLMLVSGTPADRVRCSALRRSNRRARVLVPTRAMQALLTSTLGLDSEVVPLGVDHDVFSPGPAEGGEILVVGDLYRHKRHDLAIAAWARLREPRPLLRLLGDRRVHRAFTAEIQALVRRHARLGPIVMEGVVAPDEMPARYRAAAVLVLPSERESFCLPVVEAAACGVPVLTRDSPVLRETAGPGAAFVAGEDPLRWAIALQTLLDDPLARRRAREAGLAHARAYRWERTTAAVCDHVRAAAQAA